MYPTPSLARLASPLAVARIDTRLIVPIGAKLSRGLDHDASDGEWSAPPADSASDSDSDKEKDAAVAIRRKRSRTAHGRLSPQPLRSDSESENEGDDSDFIPAEIVLRPAQRSRPSRISVAPSRKTSLRDPFASLFLPPASSSLSLVPDDEFDHFFRPVLRDTLDDYTLSSRTAASRVNGRIRVTPSLQDFRGKLNPHLSMMESIRLRNSQMLANAVAPGTERRERQFLRTLERFAEASGLPPLDYSDSCTSRNDMRHIIAAFVEDRVDFNGSTASVPSYISRAYGALSRLKGMRPYADCPEDSSFFRRIRKGWDNTYGRRAGVKASCNAAVLSELLEKLGDRLVPDSQASETFLQILFAYHMTLRPNEHLGPDCDLTLGHLERMRNPDGTRFFKLKLFITKGILKTRDVGARVENAFAPELPGHRLDLFGRLSAYVETRRRTGATYDSPLFPADNGGFMPFATFNKRMRALFVAAGMEPIFTARSTRRGRRSDLQTSGTDQLFIMQIGRWRSLLASLPYQEEAPESLCARFPKSLPTEKARPC